MWICIQQWCCWLEWKNELAKNLANPIAKKKHSFECYFAILFPFRHIFTTLTLSLSNSFYKLTIISIESIIGHFVASSQLACKPGQSSLVNMLSSSLHKALRMSFPNTWFYRYNCQKSKLLSPSATYPFRDLHSTTGCSFLYQRWLTPTFSLLGVRSF